MEQLEQALREGREKSEQLERINYSAGTGMDRHTAKVKRLAIHFQARVNLILAAAIAIQRAVSLEFPDITFVKIDQQTYEDVPGGPDCVIGTAEKMRERDEFFVTPLQEHVNTLFRQATELQEDADVIAARARECVRIDRDFDNV